MKRTRFFVPARLVSLLLTGFLLWNLFFGLVLPAAAASSDKVIPEMSKFFGTDYTQAQMTQYSRLLTCTYDKEEGTAPLDAFLELLQEDRYQLVLDCVSDEYPDAYSTATVKDYFFHYTGTSSAIKWIKLKDGTKYHVRVSLYTYTEKDYSAIVYYSHPNFLHRDAGVTYEEIRQQKVILPEKPSVSETSPKETEPFFLPGTPDLRAYFGNPMQTDREEGRTEYYFEFTEYPAVGMRAFEKYLESIGASESYYEAFESGNMLLEYVGDEGILVSMYWLESNHSLDVTLYDADWEQMAVREEKPEQNVRKLKNWQTVKVQEDAAFGIRKKQKVTLKCTYDMGKNQDFYWSIISGEDLISLTEKKNKCKIKGEKQGTAEIEMTCFYVNEAGEDTCITSYYTIIVE